MAKSMIIYGVPGGKTRFAQRIADHFGLSWVVSEWNSYFTAKEDGLYLTSGFNFGTFELEAKSFQEVADEINASIPLTDWQSGPPPMVGEWIAGATKANDRRRWWNGKHWSNWYMLTESSDEVARCQSMKAIFLDSEIQWRGLSQEPIKVTE